MISKLFSSLYHDGLVLTLRSLWSKIANKFFNLIFSPGRFDLHVDRSARISGLSHIQIGKNFTAGKSLWLEAVLSHGPKRYNPRIVIRDNVSCSDRVHIGATHYVEIGRNVLMASDIYISDHNHGSYSGPASNHSTPQIAPNDREVNDDGKVVIGDNVWIGERVCILPGVVIGEGSVIGAGSIVTKDVPRYSIAVGNPAKVVKKYDPKAKEWRPVSKSTTKKR